MPNTTTTPNMGMVLPVPTQEIGPAWATELIAALTSKVDLHTHAAGLGVQVPTAGLNINADLAFQSLGTSYNATSLRSTRFTSQGAPLALGTDIGCLYVASGELYYNDLASRQVKLTNVGALNTTITYFPERTPAISGNFTILSTDTFALYYSNTTTVANTVNLPASSGVTVGRTYFFVDINRNASTNNITLVPNGTDKINTVAGNYVITASGSYTIITTDAAGNWYANTIPVFDPLNIATNLRWVSGFASPTITQASTASATGAPLLLQSQASTANPGTPGNIVLNTPDKVGAGTIGYTVFEGAASEVARIGAWNNNNGAQGAMWLGPIGTPTTSNFFGFCDGTTATELNGPSQLFFGVGGSNQHLVTTGGVQLNTNLIGFVTQFGGGTGVLGIASASAVPTSNPTGGGVLYAQAGASKWRGSGGWIKTTAGAGAGTQNSQAGVDDELPTFARTTATGATFTVDTPIPTGSVVLIHVRVLGRLVSGTGTVGDGGVWTAEAGFKNVAGTVSQIGTTNAITTKTDANFTGSIAFSVSSTNARLTVTAPAGEGATPTIDWVVRVQDTVD